MKSFAVVVLALAAAEALQLHPAGANGAVRTAGAIGAVRTAGALRPAARRSGEIHLLDKKGEAHSTVVFLRHGQSTWNADSLFTGWADVELTTLGKNEAAGAAAGAAAIFSVAMGATAGAAAGAAAAFSERGERKRPSSLPVPCLFDPELRGMARARRVSRGAPPSFRV